MKLHVLLLLLGLGLLGLTLTTTRAHQVEEQPEQDLEEEDEEEDEGEVDLEGEVFGPRENRHYGINLLDRDGSIIVSDPTERVLRAVVEPESAPPSLSLEKVKAMYQRLLKEEPKVAKGIVARYSNEDLQEMEAKEQVAAEQSEDDESVISRLLKLVW